jgi:hypothetical protein
MRAPVLAAALAAASAVVLAACGTGAASSTASSSPADAPAAAAAAPSPSASCALKTTFDYIERDNDPGASVLADEIGDVDLENCTPALQDFTAEAGQAPGECTSIAKASDNPGYNVNATPAPPLKDVIESAGPGC